FREGSEDFADGAEITARSLTASLSPEIPLETYIDPRLKNEVLTPNDTQTREEFSQASHVSSQSFRKSHNLPTPQLTQNRSSDILLPASLRPSSPSARSSSPTAPVAESSPASHDNESSAPIDQDFDSPLPKVQDGGKAFTALKPSPKPRRVSNIPPSLSPWFAPRRSSEVVPDSRSQSPDKSGESDASSSEEIADIEDIEEECEQEEKDEEEVPSSGIKPPHKPPTSKAIFQRTSPAAPLPTSTPPTGLRTSHAYYTPLSNLPSHFNTTTSTLSIVLGSLAITRATSGPRDFHTTLFLTDPSSLQEQKPLSQSSNSFQTSNLNTSAFTLARLFRPSRISLPQRPKKGDVILLRSCAVTSYARTASLLSSNSSAWALFSHEHHTEPAIAGPPVEFGAEERGYVRGLWEWWEQLEEDTKEGMMEAVEDRIKKLEEKEEREKMKGRRLKGMGLRLAPGMGRESENPKHELRDGKEWSDEVGKSTTTPGTPRKSRGVRHELRDGKGSSSSSASSPSSSSSFSSSSSSSGDDEPLFQNWEIPPPTRRQSITEGISPHVDPERYDPRPARKVLVEFWTDIWRAEKRDEPASPLMSPTGTKWDDMEKERGAELCESLRDRAYEEEERRETKEDDKRELAAYAEVRRMLRRKARRRKRRDDIRSAVAEWGLVKGTVGIRGGNIDRDDNVEEGEGGLGWLDIALRRGKNQRQISPERSTLGDGEDLSDDEESISNKGNSKASATSNSRPRKKQAHESTSFRTWERDETRRLKRVASTRDLRVMNKRYDLDAESAYSQSTGTFGGEAYSRSLIDFADASYETLNWEIRSLKHEHSESLIDVEVAASRAKQHDYYSHAGHLWHRRKTLSTLLHTVGKQGIRYHDQQSSQTQWQAIGYRVQMSRISGRHRIMGSSPKGGPRDDGFRSGGRLTLDLHIGVRYTLDSPLVAAILDSACGLPVTHFTIHSQDLHESQSSWIISGKDAQSWSSNSASTLFELLLIDITLSSSKTPLATSSTTKDNGRPEGSRNFSATKRYGGESPSGKTSLNGITPLTTSNVASPTAGASSAFGLGSGAFASFGSSAKTPKTPGTAMDATSFAGPGKEREKDAVPGSGNQDIKTTPSATSYNSKASGASTEHPLKYTWIVWYRPPTSKFQDYEKSTTALAHFSSVESFWTVYTHLKRPSTLSAVSDYHLFKKGIRPVWEDEENKRGGKWIVRLKKGVCDRYWEDLLLAIVGDLFAEAGEEVCGAVLSVRSGEDVLSVWTRIDGGRNIKIRCSETIKRVLAFPPDTNIVWKSHDDSIAQRSAIEQARQEKGAAGGNHHGTVKRRETISEDAESEKTKVTSSGITSHNSISFTPQPVQRQPFSDSGYPLRMSVFQAEGGPRPTNTLSRGVLNSRHTASRGLHAPRTVGRQLETGTTAGYNVKSSTLEYGLDLYYPGEPRPKRRKLEPEPNSQNTPQIVDGSDEADQIMIDDDVVQVKHATEPLRDELLGNIKPVVMLGSSKPTQPDAIGGRSQGEFRTVENLMNSSLPKSKKHKNRQRNGTHDIPVTERSSFASSKSESVELLDTELNADPIAKVPYRGTAYLHPSRRSEMASKANLGRSTTNRSPHFLLPTSEKALIKHENQQKKGTRGSPPTGSRLRDQYRDSDGKQRGGADSPDELDIAEPNSRALSPVKSARFQSPSKISQPDPTRRLSLEDELDNPQPAQSDIKPSIFTGVANNGSRSKVTTYLGEKQPPWSMPLHAYNFRGQTHRNDGLALVYNDTEKSYEIRCSGTNLAKYHSDLQIRPDKLQRIYWAQEGTKMRFQSSKIVGLDNVLDIEVCRQKDVQTLNAVLQERSNLLVKGEPRTIEAGRNINSRQPEDVQLADRKIDRVDKKRALDEQQRPKSKRHRLVDAFASDGKTHDMQRLQHDGFPDKTVIQKYGNTKGRERSTAFNLDDLNPLEDKLEHNLRSRNATGPLSRRLQQPSPFSFNQEASHEEIERYSKVYGLGKRWPKPLVYPKEGKKRTTVDFDDLGRLDEGEFLNDNLIAFYLRYLEHQAEQNDPTMARKVYMFNTFFYASLTTPKPGQRGINYEAVQKWTRGIDIFTYDFVVVPVNESAHWYIAIICNLPALNRKLGGFDGDSASDPGSPKEIELDRHGQDKPMISSSPRTLASNEDRQDPSAPADRAAEDPNEHETTASFAEMSLEAPETTPGIDDISPEIPGASHPDNPEQEFLDCQLQQAQNNGQAGGDPDAQEVQSTDHKVEEVVETDRPTSPRLRPGKRKSLASTRVFDPYKPTILTFDSFGTAHAQTVKVLKQYLREEANDKRGQMEFDEKELQGVTAKQIPQQDNFCDCGTFLLGYMEKFFDNPRDFIDKIMRRQWD
ncbi:MAG: hypothetical protein L6R42_003758, partial [Xanthoria sp. 1 TBL-2021]